MAEIILHEHLDAAPPGGIGISHAIGDLDLHVKGQLVIGPLGDQMQMTAHRPEKILGLGEGAEFIVGEHAKRHKFADIGDPVQVLGDPEQRLQIAQAALALFDVGLDHITLALLFVARVAFGKLGFGKVAFGVLEKLVPEAAVEVFGQLGIAGQMAVFQQGSADRVILGPQTQTIADRAACMADLEAQIPQDIEHRFDHALGPGGDLVGGEKQQIYIRLRRHFTAPVSTNGKDRKALGLGRVGQRVHHAGGDIKRCQDHAIGQPAIGAGHLAGLERVLGKACGNRLAATFHFGAKNLDDCAAQCRHVAATLAYGLLKPRFDGADVKDIVGRTDKIVPAGDGLCHAVVV